MATRITFLEDLPKALGGHKAGTTVTVEDAVAKNYVSQKLAEAAPQESPIDRLAETIEKGMTKGIERGVDAVTAKAASTSPPRIDLVEAEADRTKSFADFIKQVIIVGCPNLVAAGQLPFLSKEGRVLTSYDIPHAAERLAKVYKSGFRQLENKDLAEGSGTTGGYTVAPDYAKELLALAAEESIVRPYAQVKTLPAREAYYPMLNQTTAPTAGNTSYYGGVTMTWTGEAQARPATEPNFKQVHIFTNELAGLTKVSRTLLSDSMLELESELRQLFAGAIAWAEDYAFLQGDGVAKPQGVLNSPALITYGSRASSSHFALADAANMMGAMLPQSRTKAVWVITNAAFSDAIQLNDSTGRPTYVNVVGPGYSEAQVAKGQFGISIMSRPVIFTEKLKAFGTAGDILLCDFSKYIVADTGTMEIAASDQYAFNTNQITFRTIKRVDGQAQLDAPFTQADASTKISPFVALHS